MILFVRYFIVLPILIDGTLSIYPLPYPSAYKSDIRLYPPPIFYTEVNFTGASYQPPKDWESGCNTMPNNMTANVTSVYAKWVKVATYYAKDCKGQYDIFSFNTDRDVWLASRRKFPDVYRIHSFERVPR